MSAVPARGGQSLGRLGPEARLLHAELHQVPVGLSQVVAGELVRPGGQAPRERLVELGAALLREAVVGGLADERVRETEHVLAGRRGAVGTDQLLLDERDELGGDGRRTGLPEERCERARLEAPALYRGVLQHRPLSRIEPGDARRQHRLDGRGQRGVSPLRTDRRKLLEEERIALGELHDARRRVGAELLGPGALDERARLVLRKRVEREQRARGHRRRPGGPHLDELRPRQADEQDRVLAGEGDDVLEQVQEARLRPLDVIDDGHQRAL